MKKQRMPRLDGSPADNEEDRHIGSRVAAFASREIVWRPVAIAVGGAVVYLTMQMMVRGDFHFFADPPPWAGWDFVPPMGNRWRGPDVLGRPKETKTIRN